MNNFAQTIFEHNLPFNEKTAIVDRGGERSVSWRELYEKSCAVAAYAGSLKLSGLVPVCMPRCAEAAESVLGLALAGIGVAPLADSTPAARIAQIEEQTGNTAWTGREYLLAASNSVNSFDAVEFPENGPAYVVFTSGSTGTPKGVMLSSPVVEKSYRRVAGPEYLNLQPEDIMIQSAYLSFVAVITDMLAPLYAGSLLHIIPDEVRGDAGSMTEYINANGITKLLITVKQFKRLGLMPSVKKVVIGADKVSGIAPEGFDILNCWGMSETCGVCGTYLITKAMENTPIGSLTGDFRSYIVDEDGKLSNEGELCVSGAISLGYYKSPELTAKAFTPNPFFSEKGHEILLHTSDMVRRLEDGNMLYLGRKDFMIKINGQRVEPGEVEAVLSRISGIRENAVMGFTEEDGHSYLCAYYVAEEELSDLYLRNELKKQLPSYMVPAFYVRLEAMPVTRTGKLNRKAFAPPLTALLHSEYAAPQNETEAVLCSAFEQALKSGTVGIHDNFMRLGGDSIRAMSVVSLAKLPGLSPSIVLEMGTPARIAGVLGEHGENVIYDNLPANQEKTPLTASQMGVYLECAEMPESLKYNIPASFSISLPEGLDVKEIEKRFDSVLALHPALYAEIKAEGDRVYMRRCSFPAEGICRVREMQEGDIDIDAEWEGLLRPFELSTSPLCRVKAVLCGKKLHIFIDTHHIVSDGSSVSLLVKQLCGVLAGEKPVEEQIDAFALYELQNRIQEKSLATAREHFARLLDGVETDSTLIQDLKSESGDAPSKKITFEINGIDFAPLRRHGITESTLFTAAYGYALAKMTGQSESLFAFAESGRKFQALKTTVSMLVRTLPVYMRIDEKCDTRELLSSLQRQMYSSMENDCVAFGELAQQYGVNAGLMFVYQSDMLSGIETALGRVCLDFKPVNAAISKLSVSVFKTERGHRAAFEYRSDLYNEITIRRFANIFKNAAEAMAQGTSLESVRLISDSDKEFLDSINHTFSPYDPGKTIVDLFRHHAASQPEKTALIFKNRKYSYAETDDISDRIAAYLSGLGIGRESVVSVLINRSEYMLLASLGVMKAGAVYQPLDPSYPPERLDFMRRDADATLIIADRELISILPEYKGPVLFTDEIPALPSGKPVPAAPCPEDGYVLLYTSGTTGTPKGCLLTHGNLTAMVHAYCLLTGIEGSSISGAYASYGFDAHMADMYPVISAGGTAVIVPDDIRLDLPAVKDYVELNGVTHLILTTQLCVQFVLMYPKLKSLKCLLGGGEKMVSIDPPETYRLINAYGPSECTVLETAFTVDKKYDDIPIGSSLVNTKLYVVDSFNRRVPVGVPGELIISGPQVGRGYLNRPEQTEKVFVSNTFEENPGQDYLRCYHTGDIVRFVDDGNVVFMGRRDKQVKIRGFRIELSEVERVIMDYPGIRTATVTAIDSPAGGKVLNAYIVADEKIDILKLNDYIRSVKPDYMVPAASMQLESLPLTVNGKVDKRRLPKIEQHFDDMEKPENELQQKIFELAAQAVGTDEFGINTDLFLAGLSSIGSIRLCSLLADEFGVPVQIRNIKKYPTVAKLEEFIKKSTAPEENKTADHSAESENKEVRYSEDYPISKTMEGIFTECISKPDSTFYNIPYLIRLAPEIDEQRLKNAIAAAVEAHPGMKTELFTDSQGRIRQHRRLDDVFTAEDIFCLDAEDIDELRSEIVNPFSITCGRLFRISIIHAGGSYLFFDFHHIIADGTSMAIFIRDIESAYAGRKLKPEGYSGFDVAEEEQRARAGGDLAEAREYYEKLLDGLDKSFLLLGDRYAEMAPASGKIRSRLSGLKLERVKEFCRRNKIGLNAFFVSAFGFTLARYADMDYSVFNTIYNGRNDSRAADTFAMMVKTLPVVCSVENKTMPEELAAEMAAQLMDSMANDLYSYAEISRAFGLTNDVMFIYQGDSFRRSSFCGAEAEEIGLQLSESKAPMAMQVMLSDGEILCELEYDPLRFTEKLMSGFVSAYDMACRGFVENINLDNISLLSPGAEAEIESYNGTELDYDRSDTITDMFSRMARQQPEKLCVAYKDRQISYAGAWEITGKIALFLMERGIGRGDIVPILINRDENMVLTAHGVVRAGAAYLGLDPTYPSDRLEFMIADSGAKYLIADRSLMDKIPGYTGPVLYTGEIDALPVLNEETELSFRAQPRHEITPENDAFIVYSSGTTGKPKGSLLQHKAIVCFYHNYTSRIHIDTGTNLATYASFGFDGGAMDVFCSPMSGASLFVIPDEIRLDLSRLEQFYVRNAITAGFMTTQVGTMFIAQTRCRSLRSFIVGGEKLIPVKAPDWVEFMNGYGPSETMCYVNSFNIKDTGSLQPIGKVSNNTKEYIVDKHGNRQPFGACGELCISGGQMSRGYLNRPEKTAEVFTDNPFSSKEGYRKMYRSGDVVRLLPDGNYDFVGRRDGQVKIRGFRVELPEVEMQIRKFPGVEKAVVTAFDNPSGGKYLAAYVVCKNALDIAEMKTFIASEKPDYMVPAVIMQLDAIPLTSNGKVDMRRLPKGDPTSARKSAEPANETEEKLCSIFGEVLGLEKVYADDDFFAIGGSSISAIQVIVKCEQAGMNIVYKNLFANPTAQKLADFLQGSKEEAIKASDLESGDGHDYSALKYNVPENLPEICNNGLGDVLLTGATGFLGSHIFRELLNSTDGRVICLVRSKSGISAAERLEMMMIYYFDEWYTSELSRRVTVIDGDMEDVNIGEELDRLHFDTIINCAANVKHFAAGDELLGSNFNGVEKLISLAEKTNAKLIQISTVSVAGESVNGAVPDGYKFCEKDLNIGQTLENKYIYTKYLAEQALIDAVSAKRIRGKVIRLGNLQARFGDSEFQVNAGTNGFLRQFIGFAALGCFPVGMMDMPVEFSPIDSVARAVVLLSGTPDGFTVFHARNCNSIHYGYFLQAIRSRAKPIEVVEDSVFEQRLEKALENEAMVEKLGGLLAYRNNASPDLSADGGKPERRVMIEADTSFSVKALYRLGFAWPLISGEYLDRIVETLLGMNYFSDN